MLHRLARAILAAASLGVLTLGASGCDFIPGESYAVTQPQGIGKMHVDFDICSMNMDFNELETFGECSPRDKDGRGQDLFALALPVGTTVPQTIVAQPKPESGGQPLVFTRNQEVTERAIEWKFPGAEPGEEGESWQPPGTEVFGYLSQVFDEKKGEEFEWTVDLDLELPAGEPFTAEYQVGLFGGWRTISEAKPESRPIDCYEFKLEGEIEANGACIPIGTETPGVSDLAIRATSPTTQAFIGGKAGVPFDLLLGTSLGIEPVSDPLPVFSLKASTALSGATATPDNGVFQPSPPDPNTHLSPLAARQAVVEIPKNAKPGVYDVTFTATTPAGGSTSATAQLRVTKPKIKLGKLKLNRNGTATLTVSVPSAGTLTATGKGLAKAKRKPKKAGKAKLKLKAKGKAKAELIADGKVKLRVKVKFKPSSGIAVSRSRAVKLKLAS
ncbi:MAG TPA: hypothetical protein VIT85_03245 [Solirubrobacterales bacterium]